MPDEQPARSSRVACDAMCGGVARWLRVLGVDATWTLGIEDNKLVEHALAEDRVVVSADGKLFERRPLASGRLRGIRLPVGLKLREQLAFVARRLDLKPGFPRCTLCNGELIAVGRAEVGDVVPARSLVWQTEFYRCQSCRHVFWEGTHWRRIRAVRAGVLAGAGQEEKRLTRDPQDSDNAADTT